MPIRAYIICGLKVAVRGITLFRQIHIDKKTHICMAYVAGMALE